MAAGVPVVACDVPGVRDVVRSEQTGLLVPPGDPVALARAIGRILSDSGLEARLTAAAYEDVKARFGWPGVMQKYRAILRLDEAVVDQG
jgi:glycosyltransferase involved in cell wall biosynthesis